MSEENNKNLILDVLKQHPEGLTISSIAEKSGLHRHTSRKYVNELIDKGEVIQRFVGVARLCYLNCVNEVKEEKKTEKESFFKRFNIKLMLSVVLVSLLLSEVVISAYENDSFNETMTSNFSNTSAMTASMIINESNMSNIIEATIDNASNRTVGTNDSLMPATDMSTVPVDNSASTINASETSENASDNLTNQSVTDNSTISSMLNESNITDNSTISWILNDSNITDILDNVSKEIENISLPSQNETRPEFSIDLEYPQRITRGRRSLSVPTSPMLAILMQEVLRQTFNHLTV